MRSSTHIIDTTKTTSYSLSSTVCQQFISKHKAEIFSNSGSNIFQSFLVDGSEFKGNLVIYECQSVLNSTVDRNAFFKLVDYFPKKFFIHNFEFVSCGIQDKNGEHLWLKVLLKEYSDWKLIGDHQLNSLNFNREDKSDETKLIIFDRAVNLENVLFSNLEQIYFYQHYQNRKDLRWASSDNIFTKIFDNKHLQRLILSDTGLCPPFMFLEKKSSYSEQDLQNIKEALQLNEDDSIVLKARFGKQGEGEEFLDLTNLLDYLKSSECTKKFASDNVLLLEKFVNQNVKGVYHTKRYAVSGHNANNKILQLYQDIHHHKDSHKHVKCEWFENNEFSEEKIKTQLTTVLERMQNIDYSALIKQLISSQNSILILIGLDVLLVNFKILCISYKTNFNDKARLTIAGVKLNLADELIAKLEELAKCDHGGIRASVYTVVESIIEYLKFPIHGQNDTNPEIMQRLENISNTKSVVTSPESFWSNKTQPNQSQNHSIVLEESNVTQFTEEITSISNT